MNIETVDELIGKTIDFLMHPNGEVKLAPFQLVDVVCLSQEMNKGSLWYFEEENVFVVEHKDRKDLLFTEFESIDDLISHKWVIDENS